MKWTPRKKKSDDVIDIRGASKGSGSSSGGGLGGSGLGGGGLGSILTELIKGRLGRAGGSAGIIGVIVLVAIQLIGGASGFNVSTGFSDGSGAPGADNESPIPPGEDPDKDLRDFSEYVFVDAQETWIPIFKAQNRKYNNAKLVLYRDAVSTGGCGSATSAVGPFYCPADERVYLDLSFFGAMERQLQAPGDFAWAYVIAHEMGHHVQQQNGTSSAVRRLEQENPDDANELSVRLELQADCFSGVWATTVFEDGDLEEGDLDEAFTAAEAVGDDTLQEKSGQVVTEESFTHGSSEQRRTWFNRGFESGDPGNCDTFTPDDV